MTDWQVYSLEVDGGGAANIAFWIEKLYGVKAKRLKIDVGFFEDKDALLDKLVKAGVPKNYSKNGKALFVLEDGRYHFLTHALARLSGKKGYGVFDWDAHTDDYETWWDVPHKVINCRSFADLLMDERGADSLTYFGVKNEPNSDDPRVRWLHQEEPSLMENPIGATRKLMEQVAETEVYGTVDLDVLDRLEKVRVYPLYKNDGKMSLKELVGSISATKQDREIFAADITGYFPPGEEYYTELENLVTLKSCLAISVLAGEIMGLDTSKARNAMETVDKEIKNYGK